MLKVAIVGTGYVGLVTGACLAAKGHQVMCVDKDAARAEAVARGECPIHEDGLAPLLREGVQAGRLAATTDMAAALAPAQVVILAVGTPALDGNADLSAVEAASRAIGATLKRRTDFPVVVVKSTVAPGTTDTFVRRLLEEESGGVAGEDFGLCMNPEFLSQGSAVRDFLEPDRIIVGQWDRKSGDMLESLYAPFAAPILRMALREAEMAKYAANALQATLISFANQIAMLCEHMPGLDHTRIMHSVHLDRLLDGSGAPRLLMGGIGFGGSCFPKDLMALSSFARRQGAPAPLIEAVFTVNAIRPAQVLNLLAASIGGLFEKRVAVLGLAFKPGTDDLRESPAVKLVSRLQARGAEVIAHDPLPLARRHAKESDIPVTDSLDSALDQADAAILCTAWPQYREADWHALSLRMRRPVVLDGRDWLDGLDLPARLKRVRVGVSALSFDHSHKEFS